MVPRENKNNAYAKFGGTNKEYYGIFRTGLFPSCPQSLFQSESKCENFVMVISSNYNMNEN